MKQFTLLYPYARDIELQKDAGQLTWHLSRNGVKCSLVCEKRSESYTYLQEDSTFKIRHCQSKGSILGVSLGALIYLFKNSKSIHVLNLYHFRIESIVFGFIYKLLNPNGILYLKADLSLWKFRDNNFEQYETSALKRWLYLSVWPKYVFILFKVSGKVFNLITSETLEATDWIKSKVGEGARVCYLPNGINRTRVENIHVKDIKKRLKIILIVSRIGEYQKDHEMILDSLNNINLNGWQVHFCGPVKPTFMKKCLKHKKTDSFVFHGSISDPDVLLSHFANASVSIVTSRWESFCFVSLESFMLGTYLISTPVGIGPELISLDENTGEIINNKEELQESLTRIISDDTFLRAKKNMQKKKTMHEQFYWDRISQRLKGQLEEIEK